MRYSAALRKALIEAKPLGGGYSESELRRRIAAISEQLKAPMGDLERILLCADRGSLRKTLSTKDHLATGAHPADGLGEVFTMDEFNQSGRQ